MGQIERTLAKLRRQAAQAKAAAGDGAAAQAEGAQRPGAERKQVEVVPRPDLLHHARAVALDPATLDANRIRGIYSSDAGAAAYKMLRTRVLQRMRSHGWHKLAVTSPRADAGKTLTAINLAISLSQEPNQEVILVDLDLRNPQVGEYLGLGPQFGLVDHVANDVPMLNNRVLQLDLDPLGPVRTIDTLKLSKKSFRLAYNKLDYLGHYLGLGNKIKTDFDLWLRCYHGDQDALMEMSAYNVEDVLLLERVFDRIKPHVKGLPRLFDAGWDGQLGCPHCGSLDLLVRGYHRTNISTFPKFQCKGCRRYHRGRSSILQPKFKVSPL